MNRRRFLNLIAGAGTAAALPPSMVWPFRKIFLPPTIVKPTIEEIIGKEFREAIEAMMNEMDEMLAGTYPVLAGDYYTITPPPSYHKLFGLKPTPYPGRLHV